MSDRPDRKDVKFRNSFVYTHDRTKKDQANTVKGLLLKFRCAGRSHEDCSKCLRLLYGDTTYCISADTVASVINGFKNDESVYTNGKLDSAKISNWILAQGVGAMVDKDIRELKRKKDQLQQNKARRECDRTESTYTSPPS